VQRPCEWKGFLGGVRKEDFACKARTYTTEIISIDPQLIYINNFFDDGEIKGLIAEGFVFSPSSPLVKCTLSRAQSFIGSFIPPDGDFGKPQLVHYEKARRSMSITTGMMSLN
jgi:prolyl 4-hydroxylase